MTFMYSNEGLKYLCHRLMSSSNRLANLAEEMHSEHETGGKMEECERCIKILDCIAANDVAVSKVAAQNQNPGVR